LHLPLAKLSNGFDRINLKAGVPSAIELIIYFEYPSVDIQIARYQLREMIEEIFLIVDIVSTNWDRYIGHLEDPLCTRFGREDFGLLWISCDDWNRELDR